ncbi:MAG: DsbA family protein [Mailhella sp.]|nr:DsbA family protein [Mailhella sp.]
MKSFLLITDVFCPWCYGFAPVMRRLLAEYGYPVRVLCGNLVDEPMLSSEMGDPKGLAFFKRLVETTGRPVGDGLYGILKQGRGVLMDSTKAAVLLRALKKLAPGAALEQMEAFQDAFYARGLDVLSGAVQAEVAAGWGVDAEALASALASDAVAAEARRDMEEAEEILGDFVVYPTLYLRDDAGGLHAVARGYAPYGTVCEKIKSALESGSEAGLSADACGPDGCCG